MHDRNLFSKILELPHLYTWVEKGFRVKFLARQHNTMSPTRARIRAA